jgi:hypothetical protein
MKRNDIRRKHLRVVEIVFLLTFSPYTLTPFDKNDVITYSHSVDPNSVTKPWVWR